jgi:hypothetical protein
MKTPADLRGCPIEERRAFLIRQVVQRLPGVTQRDVDRVTPAGRVAIVAAKHAALAVFAKMSDTIWLEVANGFAKQLGEPEQTPASAIAYVTPPTPSE